jgi:hypothetical protein
MTFQADMPTEQREVIIGTYNSTSFHARNELDILLSICHLLYRKGFRAYTDGMHSPITGSHYNWENLMKYKTLLDFQLEDSAEPRIFKNLAKDRRN